MSIPDFQSIMRPLLVLVADSQEHAIRDVIVRLADQFELTEDERQHLLPSGRQAQFDNRVGWAKTHLTKAGLLESTRRGYFRITELGIISLEKHPERIDMSVLRNFESYRQFLAPQKSDKEPAIADEPTDNQTPEEVILIAYQQLRTGLVDELLDIVKGSSPAFFERLVVDLLLAMGYGGTREDAGKTIGRSGDEGIDGVINEDRLGLDVVYIQAKKWENTITRPEVQKFAGALQGKRARKGVFITTSRFSQGALEFADFIDSRIVLIDGQMLAGLMIDHNVGVSRAEIYEIKQIDSDYFPS